MATIVKAPGKIQSTVDTFFSKIINWVGFLPFRITIKAIMTIFAFQLTVSFLNDTLYLLTNIHILGQIDSALHNIDGLEDKKILTNSLFYNNGTNELTEENWAVYSSSSDDSNKSEWKEVFSEWGNTFEDRLDRVRSQFNFFSVLVIINQSIIWKNAN
jgi:hypothetical protein